MCQYHLLGEVEDLAKEASPYKDYGQVVGMDLITRNKNCKD